MNFKRIDPVACQQLLESTAATLLDIRDPQSFRSGHIDNALHIEDIDLERFVEEEPKNKPLVICCYHGISSQSAAAYFAEKGFTDVYSLDGGYEGWPWR
jgi:thiosulfate sulfurtransferase